MHIIQIVNDEDKKSITRNILEELPEWFGIPEAREEYIRDSEGESLLLCHGKRKRLGIFVSQRNGKRYS